MQSSRTFFSAVFLCALCLAGTAGAQSAKPNIVVFEPDDLDVVLTQRALQTGLMPNLQKFIVARGTSFRNFYVSDSRGCPTREAFFNGLYFHNVVGLGARGHQCGVFQFKDQSTLPVWLKNSGYTTSLIGKYLDGYGYEDLNGDGIVNETDATYVPPGWDHWEAFTYYQPVASGSIPPPGVILPEDNPNEYDYYVASNGALQHYGRTDAEYQADVLRQKATAYIQSLPTTNPKPLFLVVAPGAPHIETNYEQFPVLPGYEEAWSWDVRPAPRYKGTVNSPLPQPANFNAADLSNRPTWLSSKALLNPTDIQYLTKQWNDRLAALRAVDDLIGSVVGALNTKGMAQNTIFLFLSDNGWQYGNWRLGGKLTAYEPSIQVPLFISIGGGVATSGMVMSNDIAPTIADLAGATIPYTPDGTSFKPLLQAPLTPWRNRFLAEHWQALFGSVGLFDLPDYRAVRTSVGNTTSKNLLYVEYNTSEIELFDYTTDPAALTNLNNDPTRAAQRQALHQSALQLGACSGQACHNAEFQ